MTAIKNKNSISNYLLILIVGGSAFFMLYLTSIYSYLLFHSLAELFSIIIAGGIFMIAWNSRRILDNQYLLFIGIAYLFIGFLDTIHTLGYAGMGVFVGYGSNLATQLWIASRYMESTSLLLALVLMGKRIKGRSILTGYAIVTGFLLISIFYLEIFPTSYIEGTGLTPFKIWSEYMISLILLGSLVMLYRNRNNFAPNIFRLLIVSTILTIISELAFTFYVSVFDFSNLIGHFFKIASFYLIYRAIIQTGITEPYTIIFRNLKESEIKFQKSEEKFRSIAERSFDTIITMDINELVTYASPAVENMLGYSSKEMINKPLEYQINQSKNPNNAQNFKELIKNNTKGTIEIDMARKDNQQASVEVNYSPIVINGKNIGIQGIFRDITSRKKMEEQLIREKKLATIGMLAGTMAHELRNPLGVISNSVYYLNMRIKEKDDKVVKYLKILENEIERINSIISGLLDFSKEKSIERKDRDVNKIINESLERIQVPGKISVKTKFDDNLPKIPVDADRMQSVFLNIIENSFQAMSKEGKLEILTKQDKDSVNITIRDTGKGISKENLPKIFEPLFSTKTTGAGLGLAIVKQIIDYHNGTIEATSQIGKGTTITIKLPNSSVNSC